jgi:hypothetical protein
MKKITLIIIKNKHLKTQGRHAVETDCGHYFTVGRERMRTLADKGIQINKHRQT